MNKKQLNLNIQQLRGVAVAAVVLFHLNLPFAKTGYLGVDIFFVISGFLMAMLYGNITTTGSIKNFFLKRSVRLLPAYWFTIVATSIISILLCLPHEVAIINQQSAWSFFLMPNIGFWSDAEYWGGSQFRPLLHLWSLGVEFQFYVIYPFICKFFNSQFKRFMLMTASLLAYLLINEISAKTAFYMMPTRLWQFLLGIIAFEISRKIKVKFSAQIFRLVMLLLIALLGLPVQIPSQAVILITIPTTFLAACAVLVSSGFNQNIKIQSTRKLLAWIGKYSFSIYLMHFPIILFQQYEAFGGTVTGVSSLNGLIVFFIILILSSKYIHLVFEKYTRYSFNLSRLLLFCFVSIFLFASIQFNGKLILVEKFDKNLSQISNALLDQSEDRCGIVFNFLHPLAEFCPIGNSGFETKYLLIGDSHTNSIKNTVSRLLNLNEISLYINASNNSISDEEASHIIKQAKKTHFSKIIFHSRAKVTNFESLSKLIPKLNNIGIQSFYILPVPEYSFSVPKKMFEITKNKNEFPYLNYSEYSEINKDEVKLVSDLSNKFGIKIMQTAAVFCTPMCAVTDSTGLFYFDSNHLTVHGSEKMIPIIKEIIEYP